jgi:hypothetical protein
MVNTTLLRELHNEEIIDRRCLYWWQLGYEGRRLFTEQEFKEGLTVTKEKFSPQTDTELASHAKQDTYIRYLPIDKSLRRKVQQTLENVPG